MPCRTAGGVCDQAGNAAAAASTARCASARDRGRDVGDDVAVERVAVLERAAALGVVDPNAPPTKSLVTSSPSSPVVAARVLCPGLRLHRSRRSRRRTVKCRRHRASPTVAVFHSSRQLV